TDGQVEMTKAVVLVAALLLVTFYCFLDLAGLIPDRNACTTEVLQTIPNLSGMRFSVEYVNCDTLSKDESVSIYVTSAVEAKSSSAKSSSSRDLVFRYDPGRANFPLIESS